MQAFLHSIDLTGLRFDWLGSGETAIYCIILASVWQGSGFYMALMLAGLKSINSEIWSAARLDGVSTWKFYTEIIIPMMKFTFLTCAILPSLGVVKTYDIVVAMTNDGPGQSTWVPTYFTINAYWQKSNLGYTSAAAVVMLIITIAVLLPLALLTAWQQRAQGAPS
ncbi:MAG: sugar ABC transporter permease [Candidatus Devosia euplotis]|nr:sugar ABC transporter permease [Candidatus Devosia euplotis]